MTRLPFFAGEGCLDRIVNDWKGEPAGFSRSGLREPNEIPPRQCEWNRLLLDRRGMGVPGVANRVENFGGEVELGERQSRLGVFFTHLTFNIPRVSTST